jgi:CRISPR-associated protein Cas5d
MVLVEFYGPYGCFTRPEMKVERVSYDVPTPSAIIGMLESIYWHPGMKWVVDRIYVLNPIIHTNIRRNEVKDIVSCSNMKSAMRGNDKPQYIAAGLNILQRAALILKDVRYVIEAHFDLTNRASDADNSGKFQDIICRRLEKGQCYSMPYLGTREFPADFKLWPKGKAIETINDTRDLGYMLYSMDYSNPENIQPTFFHAQMYKGVIDLRNVEVLR